MSFDIRECRWSKAFFETTGVKDQHFYMESNKLVALIKEAGMNLLNQTNDRFGRIAETSFDEAVEIFKQFLTDNEKPNDIVWFFAEDVERIDLKVSLRTFDKEGNRKLASGLYEYGKERGFGIEMKAFALQNTQVFSYITIPEDKLDAEYRLINSVYVKFTCLTPLFPVTEPTNALTAIATRLFSGQAPSTSYGDRLPSRKKLKSRLSK